MTAIEKIILEIDNELQTLESLHGSEIMGRKIGLAFAKRIAEQTKEGKGINYFIKHELNKSE